MIEQTLYESIDRWSPEQLLAVHDFCQLVSDTIWKHHSDRLIEHLNGESSSCQSEPPRSENLELPFTDEPAF